MLLRLPPKTVAVISQVLERIATNPYRLGKPLRLELSGRRSARAGVYRVIYLIDAEAHRVDVVAIQHRGHAYKAP